VVDRIEGTLAVLVHDGTGDTLDVPLTLLPAGTRGGTHLRVTRAADRVEIRTDEAGEEAAREEIRSLQERLRARRRAP